EVPADPGYLPKMGVGAPAPAEPKDRKLIPRFPILVQDDIPLFLVFGYSLFGVPEGVGNHVAYFRRHGVLRAKPLAPAEHPLAVAGRLPPPVLGYLSEFGQAPNTQSDLLRGQLYRLVYSVYRKKGLRIRLGRTVRDGYDYRGLPWGQAVADVAKLRIRW